MKGSDVLMSNFHKILTYNRGMVNRALCGNSWSYSGKFRKIGGTMLNVIKPENEEKAYSQQDQRKTISSPSVHRSIALSDLLRILDTDTPRRIRLNSFS